MYTETSLKERCQRILEENGGYIADQASNILLEDPALKDLRAPLEFISKNWREPLTPSMMSLACEAVGGSSKETHETSLAMSLMHLCFYVWDDMVDKANFKSFKPTLFGKFGEGPALIIGGLASAKAFSILNRMNVDVIKRQEINKLIWELWTKMAQAEATNLRLRKQGNVSYKKKFTLIKMEASDLETCIKIGAILGNGSKDEIKSLAHYGRFLGIILEFWKSFHVTTNLTMELAEKLKSGAHPFLLLWAKERSEKLWKKLENLTCNKSIGPSEIKEIVEYVLETNVINHAKKNIRRFTNKAKTELAELTDNEATQKLRFLVVAQPQLFIESLSPIQL
jgi:geranylgeranyl pyrophosphate synthase